MKATIPGLQTLRVVAMGLANASVRNNGSYPAPEYNPSFAVAASSFGAFLSEIWNTIAGVASYLVNSVEKVASVIWSVTAAAQAYVAGLVSSTITAASHGLQTLATQGVSVLKLGERAMRWALDQLVVKVIEPLLQPILNAMQSFDATLATEANATLTDETSRGYVTQADGENWAHAFDSIGYLGIALAIGISVAIAIMSAVSLGAHFLVSVLISLLPTLAQQAFPASAGTIATLTSQAVLDFGSYLSSISSTDWAAIAGSVAIAASGLDFVWSEVALVLQGNGAAAGYAGLALAISTIVDLVVLSITAISWAVALPILVGIALVFAGIGLAAALVFHESVDSQLGAYANVAWILAGVGAAAALADYTIHDE